MKKPLEFLDSARGGLLVRLFAGIEATAKWLLTVASWVLLVAAFNGFVLRTPSMTGLGAWLPKATEAALLVYILMSVMKLFAWGAGIVTPGWKERVAAMPHWAHWLVAALVLFAAAPLSSWGMMVWYEEFSKAVSDLIWQLTLATNRPG
ncbi:MAG: hypothetical protein F4X40_03365 [Chloroflexi bacterium]|nr:hypothetical protein [Chloroflexota bacterium]